MTLCASCNESNSTIIFLAASISVPDAPELFRASVLPFHYHCAGSHHLSTREPLLHRYCARFPRSSLRLQGKGQGVEGQDFLRIELQPFADEGSLLIGRQLLEGPHWTVWPFAGKSLVLQRMPDHVVLISLCR